MAVEQAGKYGMAWIQMAATIGELERSIDGPSYCDTGGTCTDIRI
jgi:hypothetical protein